MAVLFLSIALWWALGTLIGGGWAGVVVAVLWAVIALILYIDRSQRNQGDRGGSADRGDPQRDPRNTEEK